jgi:hypothetical protein
MTATTESFELTADPRGKLTLKRPGQDDVADVRIRRAFPWSHADRYVSIRNADGKELLLVDDVAQLPTEQRRMIESTLAASVFIPQIRRVDRVVASFGFQQWTVQTDRGPAEFRVQEREDIRFLPDGRFSVRDADGNVYEMPPLAQLDDHSKHALGPVL